MHRIATFALLAALTLPSASALPLGPDAPTGLAVAAGPDAGALTLTWSAAQSLAGVTAYHVYRVADDGTPTLAGSTDGATLTFTDAGLGNGVTVAYVVTAEDLLGEGPASEPASGTTFALPGAPEGVAAAPGAWGTVGEAVVSWSAPASDGGAPVFAYRVYRDGALVAEVDGATLSWSDAGLVPLSDHAYAVSAVNLVGEGAASESACATASPWGLGAGEPACLGLA